MIYRSELGNSEYISKVYVIHLTPTLTTFYYILLLDLTRTHHCDLTRTHHCDLTRSHHCDLTRTHHCDLTRTHHCDLTRTHHLW